MDGDKIRINCVGEFPKCKPGIADSILEHYRRQCEERGLNWSHFSVFESPKSLNHAYQKRVVGGRRINYALDKQVVYFRDQVKLAMMIGKQKWKPTGVTAIVIFFESPLWITKKRTVREMDVDNKIKAVADAVEKASGSRDHYHWNVHAFKILSKVTRTTVYLFDLGDIVEQFE